MTTFTTIAALATPIIRRPFATPGFRIRSIASHPISSAMNTSETALASAASTPTRW